MRKVLTIADAHFPNNISTVGLCKYIERVKPTDLIFLGDIWDLSLIGHWGHQELLKQLGIVEVRRRMEKEAVGLRNYLKTVISACGNSLRNVFYFYGNHEVWLPKYEAIYCNVSNPISLEYYLEPKKTGITRIIPQGQVLHIGHLRYLHGDNYNSGAITTVCKKILEDYNACSVFGHFHTVCEVSKSSVESIHEKKFAKCIGTMGHQSAEFEKHKPNQWQNAFHIAFIKENGIFNDYTVRIINNQFIGPDGRQYVS